MRHGNGNGQLVLAGAQDDVMTLRANLIKIAVPWVLLLVVLAAGAVAHAYWGADAVLPWITSALTLAVAGLTWLSWVVTAKNRFGPLGRAHVAVTVAATGVWLLLAIVLSPWTRGVIDAFWFGGAVLALSWNLRGVIHRPARKSGDGDEDGPTTPRKAGARFMASLGMKGDNIVPEEVNEFRVGGRLALTSGNHTFEDAQKLAPKIATALGIPMAGVRIAENTDNAAEPEFSFTLRDVLNKSIPWPGPAHVGGTPFDPIPMGVYETGKPMRKTVADKTGAKQEITQGMTGAGKSSGAKIELAEHMTRRETALMVVDTVKGLQTFAWAAPGLALFIIDTAKAQALLMKLMKVVTGRASWLGARGLSEWRPGCGLSFLVVQIEEAGNLLAEIGDEELELLVKAARSAGVRIVVSLQRPSHDQISTTARAQLGTVTCYGMASDDPVCMLPDAVTDAGANPRKWNDRQPGCCYVAGTGISVGDAATPLRNYDAEMAQLEAHAADWGPRMDPVDPVTTALLGELWTRRERPVDMVRRLREQSLRTGPAGFGVTEGRAGELDDEQIENANNQDQDDHHQDDEDQDEVMQVTPDEMGIELDDDERDPDDMTIDSEIEPLDGDVNITFGRPGAKVPVTVARAALAARLAEIEASGVDTAKAPDFTELVKSGMRSRAWISKELKRLVRIGRLAETAETGQFRIIPGVADPDGDSPDDDDQDDDRDGLDDRAAA